MTSNPKSIETDLTLLRRYAETGCERSFARLTERYARMVYAVAKQRLGTRELAEEVAQNVFVALARKASKLRKHEYLGPWLHRATLLECAAAYRSEQRRIRRLEKLATMKEIDSQTPGTDSPWLPLLDEAVGKLKDSEQDLVFQRFFQGMNFAEIGDRCGISEATGRKRMSRILKKLSGFMAKRGVSASAVALGSAMTGHWAKAAPAGLAQSLSQTAVSGATAASASNLTLFTTMITSKLTGASLVAVGAALPLSLQWAYSSRDSSKAPPSRVVGKRDPGGVLATYQTDKSISMNANPATDLNLAALARELRRLPLPRGSFKREVELELLMHSLTESQVRSVVELVRNAPNANALGRITGALFARWATFSPDEAAKTASELKELRVAALTGTLSHWARRDSSAAYSFMEQSVLSASDMSGKAISAFLIDRMIRITGDREEAVERMESLEKPDLREAMVEGILKSWSKEAPEEAFAWVNDRDDYGTRNRYVDYLIHQLAGSQPAKAFEFALSLEQPRLREEAARWTLMQWPRQNPAEARAAYISLPDEIRTEHLTRNTAPLLASDAEAAFSIAEQLPAGFHRNEFEYQGIRKLARQSVADAAQTALTLSDTATRTRALEYVGKEWLKTDAELARAWIKSESGLPQETVNQLLHGK